MTNLMDQAQGLDMTDIEQLLDDVAALDEALAEDLREAIDTAGDALAEIAKQALMEAENNIEAAAHWRKQYHNFRAHIQEGSYD